MTSNCSDPALLARLLAALAAEADRLGGAIALLGEQVSAGADIVALQSFDILSQQACAQGALIGLLAAGADRPVLAGGIAAVPLPAMRARLLQAIGGETSHADVDAAETVIWLEGA
jgi:hypothetical protein